MDIIYQLIKNKKNIDLFIFLHFGVQGSVLSIFFQLHKAFLSQAFC